MSLNRTLDFVVGVPSIAVLEFFRRKPTAPPNVKKILVIKLAAVGDTILLSAVLPAFRAAHPGVEIHWLVSNINRTMAQMIPGIDKYYVWEGLSPSHFWELAQVLRNEKYDIVYDLEQWSRGTALLSFLTGAPHRVGFETPEQFRHGLFTTTVKKEYDRHEIEDFYAVMSFPTPLERKRDFHLEISQRDRELLDEKMPATTAARGPLVVIHPGCGADGSPREWPLGNYAVVANWLIKKYDARIVITAGPEERVKSARLNALLSHQALDLGGLIGWGSTLALVQKADLVISGNTGVMHAAAAFGTKQVALHGPTNPQLWGPLNANATVVSTNCPDCPSLKLGFEYHARNQECMKKIGVEEVKGAVLGLIDKNRSI